jgi:hypothetical protein
MLIGRRAALGSDIVQENRQDNGTNRMKTIDEDNKEKSGWPNQRSIHVYFG